MNPSRSVHLLEKKFRAAFDERVARGSKRPLPGALFATFKKEFILGGICQFMMTCASTISPFILKYLIAFSTEAWNAAHDGTTGPSLAYGIGLVIVVTLLQTIMTFSINHFLYLGMTVGGQARAILISMIFDKAMKISGRAKAGTVVPDFEAAPETVQPGSDEEKQWYEKMLPKKKYKKANKGPGGPGGDDKQGDGWSNGRIVNLMSMDTYRIDQASGFFHQLWGSPLSLIVTMVLLMINLTYSALPGLGLLFLTSPALARAIRALFVRRTAVNKITDQRVSLTQEILQSIRFVKLFAWEMSFRQRVDAIRRREVRAFKILFSIRDAIQAVGMAMPVFASMLSFITYSLTNHALSPAPIFSSLSLFNNLRMPLNMFPMVLGQVVDAYSSSQRIEEFLMAEEVADDIEYNAKLESAITMEDATFTWEQTKALTNDDKPEDEENGASTPSTMTMIEPFQLPNMNLSIGRSELVGLIGSVGSGKSSLLSALGGEMRRSSGSVTFGASRAFCPQYAWIQNASVRDNITFGKDFDQEWYDKVTDACALRKDFQMLPQGDKTEIGERGITVSGGQKQRINIARAIYFNADIVLMDDPLSAVDAHVGRQIMDQAICGLLANKCRVLATHQLHVLPRCDRIIWLDEGHIKAEGSYEQLMAENDEFAKLMTLTSINEEDTTTKEEEAEEPINNEERLIKIETAKDSVALMQAEERAVNAVSWSVYGAYLRATGSIFVAPLVIFFLALSQAGNIITSLWLSWWTAGQYDLSMGAWVSKEKTRSSRTAGQETNMKTDWYLRRTRYSAGHLAVCLRRVDFHLRSGCQQDLVEARHDQRFARTHVFLRHHSSWPHHQPLLQGC